MAVQLDLAECLPPNGKHRVSFCIKRLYIILRVKSRCEYDCFILGQTFSIRCARAEAADAFLLVVNATDIFRESARICVHL